MLLLDTNVLSEFMRPQPAETVVAWLDAQPVAQLYTNAVSRAEIELGLALMPAGKRQVALAQAAQAMFDEDFAGQCLPFDEPAASAYARIVAARTRAGRPIGVEDAQIAAIALVHGLRLVTRNVSDFSGIEGLAIVDPWQAVANNPEKFPPGYVIELTEAEKQGVVKKFDHLAQKKRDCNGK